MIQESKPSLRISAKASLHSLLAQSVLVFSGLILMLLLTGGNPKGGTVALSFTLGVAWVAWTEAKRLSDEDLKRQSSNVEAKSFDSQYTKDGESIAPYKNRFIQAAPPNNNISETDLDEANLDRSNRTGVVNPLAVQRFMGTIVTGVVVGLGLLVVYVVVSSGLGSGSFDVYSANNDTHMSSSVVVNSGSLINEFRGINLPGADLTGADLIGADLKGANLEGANLEGANLEGANLWRANLHEASLSEASLKEANLWRANLERANLKEANLYGANLWRANLERANLQGANLQGANFQRADLTGADLIGADLKGANLQGADLYGANLQGADLEGANLEGASLYKANLRGANLKRANLKEALLMAANIEKANLREASVENAIFSSNSRGLTKQDKADLKSRGAIFNEVAEDSANP
jgi:uncharacterized protein YjbI with pentapeptide repeats